MDVLMEKKKKKKKTPIGEEKNKKQWETINTTI